MWRVMAQHGNRFALDEVELFIVDKRDDGNHIANLMLGVDDEALDPMVATDLSPSMVMPRELAETIYEALGAVLTGVTEPAQEIHRLRAQLKVAEARVDKLIDGIGRMGGHES